MATHTNFCSRSGGSNLNAGTRTGDTTVPGTSAFKTYTGGTWVQATRTFTPAGGADPSADGIAVGDFVSITTDAATGDTGYVARISTVGATTFVTDATAKSGTAPGDGTANMTARIGGAWVGPSGTSGFPLNFVTSALTNVAGNNIRLNFLSDLTSAVTAAITGVTVTGITYQGFTTSYGDTGRWVLDGGTTGAAYTVLATASTAIKIRNIEIKNNGATGGSAVYGLSLTGTGFSVENSVFRDLRGPGFRTNTYGTLRTVEIYGCNQSNTASQGGILLSSGAQITLTRGIIHHNTGTLTSGAQIATGALLTFRDTVFWANGLRGVTATGSPIMDFDRCDFYANVGDGVIYPSGSSGSLSSCNFIDNGGYGINPPASANIRLVNNGYGSGTMANVSGDVNNTAGVDESGAVTYAANVTPWQDPDNGDFRIALSTAKGAGDGTFLETAAGYSGTVGYPDIGAAQHLDSAAVIVPVAQSVLMYGRTGFVSH